MAKAARRHYRAAKREIQVAPGRGLVISNKQKSYLTMAVAGLMILVFIKGILLGYILKGRD